MSHATVASNGYSFTVVPFACAPDAAVAEIPAAARQRSSSEATSLLGLGRVLIA
jgi:hypothetical protein